ncbi:fibronectin type III-like domain-contianing protein [Streptomyces sp. NPDC002265]|uniref:fibronectin type III-like domain-contianing protein n=1 Tax=Streptomyces sp. NPDC002265 TaxID=3154415 RepID=UPI00331D58FA
MPTRVDTPARTLAGFARVALKPGERTTAKIEISRRLVSFWDEDKDRWTTPTGKVPVYVGTSVADAGYAGSITVK